MTRRRKAVPGDATRAVAYLRASTERQDLSPGAQRAAIERWAAGAGVVVVAWHEDLGVSGGTALEDRPGLLSALDGLDALGAGTLVVAKRDRLARDVLTAALVERLCGRKGARVVAADGVANGDGPEAALMRTLLDAFAAYERALIRARTRAALAVKKSRGERTGGVPMGRGGRAACGERTRSGGSRAGAGTAGRGAVAAGRLLAGQATEGGGRH